MADDDPFKRAVAALKAGAAADKAFVAAEKADRAALLEAVRQYRRGAAAIAEATACGRYKANVLEALAKKDKVVAQRLKLLGPQLTPQEAAQLEAPPPSMPPPQQQPQRRQRGKECGVAAVDRSPSPEARSHS